MADNNALILLAGGAALLFLATRKGEATTAEIGGSNTPQFFGGEGSTSGALANTYPAPVITLSSPDFPQQAPYSPSTGFSYPQGYDGGKKAASIYAIPSNFKPLTDAQGNVIGFASPEGQAYPTLGFPVQYGETGSRTFLGATGQVVGIESPTAQASFMATGTISNPVISSPFSGGSSGGSGGAPSSKKIETVSQSTGASGGYSPAPAPFSSMYGYTDAKTGASVPISIVPTKKEETKKTSSTLKK